MTTPAKLAANKRNAQRSTGPKTAAGKAVARMNALSHGFRAASPVVPGESAELWEEFREAVVEDLAPVGFLESELAERVALLSWRMRRVANYEAGVTAIASDRLVRRIRGEETDEHDNERPDDKPTLVEVKQHLQWAEDAIERCTQRAELFARFTAAPDDAPFSGDDALDLLRNLTDYLPEDHSPIDDFDLDDFDLDDFDLDNIPPLDPMIDPDSLSFLMALDVPEAHHDEPEEWDGWTAGKIRLGLARVGSTVKWSGAKLEARAVSGSAADVVDARKKLADLQKQLVEVERTTAIEEVEARRRSLLAPGVADTVMKYESYLHRQLSQTLEELEHRQATRAARQSIPTSPSVTVREPLRLPAHSDT